MADAPVNPTSEAAANAPKPASAEPEIHVIPEKFYGAALKQKAGKLPPPPEAKAPAPPAPPTPPQPPTPPGAPKKKRSKLPIVLALVGVLLIGGGAGAYFLFFAPKPKSVTQAPAPAAPRGPICGDAKCEGSETYASCAADCKAPEPVCGDTKCEGSETPESCASDCKPPAPVCGDKKCEAPTETIEVCPADCKPPEPVPGVDSDSDGLTDEEERTVFGTRTDEPNSDRDSFVDLNEALNLFDPARPAPSMLADNPGFTLHRDEVGGFQMLRPSGWVVRTGEEGKTAFAAQTGETISVSVIASRETGQSLLAWYLAQAPGVTGDQIEPYRTRQGYEAIVSPDRRTAYVDVGDRIFVVSYDVGTRGEIQYKVTFQSMVQSLKLLP